MQVFLKPADWDEEKSGSRPVIQLDVLTKNYIQDGVTVSQMVGVPWRDRVSHVCHLFKFSLCPLRSPVMYHGDCALVHFKIHFRLQ